MEKLNSVSPHSPAWIIQTWISFVVASVATMVGIFYLPVNSWTKGYLSMGMLFTVGSTISLSKTVRDIHEANKFLNRIDEAKLEKLLAEHNPFQK